MLKQNSSGHKKEGGITRSERTTSSQMVTTILKNIKDKTGEVVQIAISSRTTIEIPANLTKVERDERVAMYIRLHKSII